LFFITFISGLDVRLYSQLPAATQTRLYGFNIWFLCSALLCALSSAYLLIFTTGLVLLAIAVGLAVLTLFLVVQAILLSIPGTRTEILNVDESNEMTTLPWIRSVLIYVLAFAFSFPLLLSVQNLSLLLHEPTSIELPAKERENFVLIESQQVESDKNTLLTKSQLISVPDILHGYPVFYMSSMTVLIVLLLIAAFVAAPFILRDRLFLSEYEKNVYDDNHAFVETQYQHYQSKNDLFAKDVAHPFETVLTGEALVQSMVVEMEREEKKEFIGQFFKASPEESGAA